MHLVKGEEGGLRVQVDRLIKLGFDAARITSGALWWSVNEESQIAKKGTEG